MNKNFTFHSCNVEGTELRVLDAILTGITDRNFTGCSKRNKLAFHLKYLLIISSFDIIISYLQILQNATLLMRRVLINFTGFLSLYLTLLRGLCQLRLKISNVIMEGDHSIQYL